MYFVLFAILMALFLIRLGDLVRLKGYRPWPARVFGALLISGAFYGGGAFARRLIERYQSQHQVEGMDHPIFLMMFGIPLVCLILTTMVLWVTAKRLPDSTPPPSP